jgi:hypothetical protein
MIGSTLENFFFLIFVQNFIILVFLGKIGTKRPRFGSRQTHTRRSGQLTVLNISYPCRKGYGILLTGRIPYCKLMQIKAAGYSLVSTFCSSGANSFTNTPLVEAHFVYGADLLIV